MTAATKVDEGPLQTCPTSLKKDSINARKIHTPTDLITLSFTHGCTWKSNLFQAKIWISTLINHAHGGDGNKCVRTNLLWLPTISRQETADVVLVGKNARPDRLPGRTGGLMPETCTISVQQMLTLHAGKNGGGTFCNQRPCQANRLSISQGSRPYHCDWQPETCRIGEAKKPGPSICSVNPGGWSRVAGTLDRGHDVVVVQETFLIRAALATGHFLVKQHGYYSAFTPAKKPASRGRPVGGLAVLCKKAQPLLRMQQGHHCGAGGWAHHSSPTSCLRSGLARLQCLRPYRQQEK
eukprot:1289403-Amphidinium_carterae.2